MSREKRGESVEYRGVFCKNGFSSAAAQFNENIVEWVLPIVGYVDFQDTVSWSILGAGDQ